MFFIDEQDVGTVVGQLRNQSKYPLKYMYSIRTKTIQHCENSTLFEDHIPRVQEVSLRERFEQSLFY